MAGIRTFSPRTFSRPLSLLPFLSLPFQVKCFIQPENVQEMTITLVGQKFKSNIFGQRNARKHMFRFLMNIWNIFKMNLILLLAWNQIFQFRMKCSRLCCISEVIDFVYNQWHQITQQTPLKYHFHACVWCRPKYVSVCSYCLVIACSDFSCNQL